MLSAVNNVELRCYWDEQLTQARRGPAIGRNMRIVIMDYVTMEIIAVQFTAKVKNGFNFKLVSIFLKHLHTFLNYFIRLHNLVQFG